MLQTIRISHIYRDGSHLKMGDELDVEISKTTTKKGVIKFEQSAFGVQFDASHKNLFTPLCCFGEQVKFSKRKSSV